MESNRRDTVKWWLYVLLAFSMGSLYGMAVQESEQRPSVTLVSRRRRQFRVTWQRDLGDTVHGFAEIPEDPNATLSIICPSPEMLNDHADNPLNMATRLMVTLTPEDMPDDIDTEVETA